MYYLWNKFTLFLSCLLLAALVLPADSILLPMLTAVFLTALIGYFRSQLLHRLVFIGYLLLCILSSSFLFFLPLLLYDYILEDPFYYFFPYLIPAVLHFDVVYLIPAVFLVVLLGLSVLLKHLYTSWRSLKEKHEKFQDNMTETAELLKQTNFELLEKQDYEIRLATLDERNRIAREIHDNVGHLISSALIQTGALLAIAKDDLTREYLGQLKETLSTGMDNIRHSIHNIHEESVDLKARLESLTDAFTFCDIDFQYNISTELPVKTKYTLLFIIKESLTNIMKHSDADHVTLVCMEHPAFYQIIIQDNGRKKENDHTGMGLHSMAERIEQLQGTLNINREKGFGIFISLPKGDHSL